VAAAAAGVSDALSTGRCCALGFPQCTVATTSTPVLM
jgi:hypothetical protein